ncbi:MAG: Gfo/Idh/MocA family oxidoreductase [Anaerolineales bacterium]
MRFLIAGFGSIGRRHFRNLLELGQGDIIFYRTHKSTLDDDELSNFIVETDLDKALAHNPDAVIVSNPTAFHLDVAIPAARAGCDILLEKPVSHNMERIEEFKRLVNNNHCRVLVGFQFRFHPGLRKIKEFLENGRIGRPLSMRAHWGEYLPGWHPWEDYRQGYSARADLGGGVILTLSHPFDYLRWLLGEVSAVWAFTESSSALEVNVEDTAEIGLRFKNDCIGSVHLNYTQRPPSHWLEIVGSQGTIQWRYDEGGIKVYDSVDGCWHNYPPKNGFYRNDLFLDEMEHFIDIICHEIDPVCSLDDGMRVQEIIKGIKSSTESGRIQFFG